MHYIRICLLVAGQKRPLDEDNSVAAEGGDGPDRMLKKARGEGPHVELRVLLQSKVSNRTFASVIVLSLCISVSRFSTSLLV